MPKKRYYWARGSMEIIDPPFGFMDTKTNAEMINDGMSTSGPGWALGGWHRSGSGLFILAKAGASTVTKGLTVITPTANAVITVAADGTAGTSGNNYIEIVAPTYPASGQAKNYFRGGKLYIIDGTGQGEYYDITGNEVWTAAADTPKIYIDPPLITTLDATSVVKLIKSPYDGVLNPATTNIGTVLGGAMATATTTKWFWIQAQGLGMGTIYGTITIAEALNNLSPSVNTAGELEETTAADTGKQIVAQCVWQNDSNGDLTYGTDSNVEPVIWKCPYIY